MLPTQVGACFRRQRDAPDRIFEEFRIGMT
jgi:hypothetical protein